jgi:amidase
VAAAANLATVTVGSETQGSIISPAKVNSVVGLKTSHGLVSGDYIIPLVDWMDVAGPIGRNVTDVAILLAAMTGVDGAGETDPALAAAQATDFAQFASLEAAEGLTIGVPIFDDAYVEGQVRSLAAMDIEVTDELRQSLQADAGSRNEQMRAIGEMFSAAGLETVEVSAAGLPAGAPILEILEVGFQDSFNRFAANADAGFPVAQLADVVELNGEDLANRAPYGQSFVQGSVETEQSAEEYATLRERVRQEAAAAFRTMLAAAGADLLLISDLGRDITQEYAAAGFPAITVPMGYSDDGMPVGVLLMGDYLGEPELIAAAYAIEQATQARQAPDLDAVIETFEGLTLATPAVE